MSKKEVIWNVDPLSDRIWCQTHFTHVDECACPDDLEIEVKPWLWPYGVEEERELNSVPGSLITGHSSRTVKGVMMAAVVRKQRPEGGKSISNNPKRSLEEFELPVKKSKPKTSIGDYIILLFGEKKIGKTMLSAQFPDAYHIMWEPGGKALEIYQSEFSDWGKFKKAITKLRSDDRFNTVVIDTVDLAFKAADAYACSKLAIDDAADEEWGKGWRAIRREFERQIHRLISAGKGIIFISHAMEREIKTRRGSSSHRVVSTMPRQAAEIIEGLVDIWACFTYDGDKRVLVIGGDEDVSAGHRLDNRFRWKGESIKKIPMGLSAEEGYENFVDAFENNFNPNGDKKPVIKKGLKRRS